VGAFERGRAIVATRSIALIVVCTVLVPTKLLAQASIYYVYDSLNRLVAVVDQQGSAATYTYDAVGNILRIDRFEATGPSGGVAISLFTPSAGAVGTTVQVFGRGFARDIAQNSLFFGDRIAALVAAAPNRLVATVPAGATTAPLTVMSPLGSVTSRAVFHVLGALTITPAMATSPVSGRVAFVATEAGAPVAAVRWAVNGLTGGDSSIGTISAEGFYTAPAAVPVPPTVTITATHDPGGAGSAAALVTVVPAFPLFLATRPVSIAAAVPPLRVDRNVRADVSVKVEAPHGPTLSLSAPVSVEIEPVILALDPARAAPGETIVLTLTGRGLDGATSLVFLRNNGVDSRVAIAALSVDADGTRGTAHVTLDASAPRGPRVVQITTADRASSPAGAGGNVFTVE
jgi:YD repeat-containing protein